jgi:hypothetical protein
MPYIGNPIYQSAFVTDTFNGTGSQTAYTMSVAPAGTSNVLVVVSGVVQDPSTYGVVGNTLNFTTAPPPGTANISCRYLGVPVTGVTTTAYRTVTEFTATASQTTFTPPSYTVGFINVYLNGVLLGSADYTASNGTTVVLATGAAAGNILTVESFLVSSVLNAISNTTGSISSSNLPANLTITTPTIDKINTSVTNTSLGAGNASIMKNRIINGAFTISQYNGTTAVNPIGSGYSIDRFYYYGAQASKLSFQQNAGSVTPPVGFSNYAGFTSLSAYSLGSTDQFLFQQAIEGFNTADLNWGTANAKTVTLSAWVYSSLTGTFGGAIQNSASNRCYPFSYSIPTANTWTQISVTIAGDTTGTWIGATNGTGMKVIFSLGSGTSQSSTAGAWTGTSFQTSCTGAVSVVGTSGATFYITGVQLEVGSSATGYEYRQYGTEFDLCRRYFEIYSGTAYVEGQIIQGIAQVDGASRPEIMLFYYPKRTGPTISATGNFQWNSAANTAVACTYVATYVGTFTYGANLFFTNPSGTVTPGTLSGVGTILFGSSGGSISMSAEL